MSAFAVLC